MQDLKLAVVGRSHTVVRWKAVDGGLLAARAARARAGRLAAENIFYLQHANKSTTLAVSREHNLLIRKEKTLCDQ